MHAVDGARRRARFRASVDSARRGADASMSTGLPTAAASGRNVRSALVVASASAGSSSPCASQASAARMPGPPALVRIATRLPRGTGWLASSVATSNSSSIVVVRMTPACWNSASTMTVARGQGAGVRRRRARAHGRPAGLDRDDRLGASDPARDLAELARIAEALQVQQDHVGVRVLGPVLDQVVARHVGLVAHRNERREADVQLARVVEDGESECTALRRHRDAGPVAARWARTWHRAWRPDRC